MVASGRGTVYRWKLHEKNINQLVHFLGSTPNLALDIVYLFDRHRVGALLGQESRLAVWIARILNLWIDDRDA